MMHTLDVICPICSESDTIKLTDDEYANYQRWLNRELLIQDALPNLSCAQREQIKTGICSKCWIDIFGKDD